MENSIKITLRIKGENKTFINDFVSARVFKNALSLNKHFSEGRDLGDVTTFEKMVEFICMAFDHKFTVEDVWDGLSAAQIQTEPVRIFNEALSLGGLAVKTPPEEGGNEPGE
ncbi:phage tail assembly chaperone G [Sporosarcina sp. FSL W7-1283]|uniref:phage tail assembly chaperone G n=1 Tax=Sporosarcina sp. FSL W7-1283 TaxID=2921560 RepID=UPI0030FC6B56